MQDRYAGDVGDFSKFQLLRALHRLSNATLGVSWYLYPNESHNNDGRHLSYQSNLSFTEVEPELTQQLRSVSEGIRCVARLEGARVLPDGTQFFGESVPSRGGPERRAWFERSLLALSGSEIVMADPDNGLLARSVGGNSRQFGKYITEDEVNALLQLAPLVVLYHHFGRSGTHLDQSRIVLQRIQANVDESQAIGMRFRRYSPRLYVLVTRDPNASQLAKIVAENLSVAQPDKWEFIQSGN